MQAKVLEDVEVLEAEGELEVAEATEEALGVAEATEEALEEAGGQGELEEALPALIVLLG